MPLTISAVYDPDSLAKKHLGHWFKHNKFPSFVRQLNMYGFHKIPHLQQGVLHNNDDDPTAGKAREYNESWEFKHPLFQRGAEAALGGIERKKGGAKGASAETQPMFELPALPMPQPQLQLPAPVHPIQQQQQQQQQQQPQQPLDVMALVSTLATLNRTQASIATQLEELKRSNQGVWEEIIEGRKRWESTRDTVGRIVKFLAGVFGGGAVAPNIMSSGIINNLGFGDIGGVGDLEEVLAHGSTNGHVFNTGAANAGGLNGRLMIEGRKAPPKVAERDGDSGNSVYHLIILPT